MARKRSRKRRKQRRQAAGSPGAAGSSDASSSQATAVADEARPPAATRRRSAASGPPPPLWGSFPLSELVILIGLVLLIAGFFVAPPRGFVMLATGLTLASLGGLELAIREHLAGYRSHTVLLSAATGIVVLVGSLVAGLPPAVAAAGAAAAFGLFAWLLVGVFRRRSGGAIYRIKD